MIVAGYVDQRSDTTMRRLEYMYSCRRSDVYRNMLQHESAEWGGFNGLGALEGTRRCSLTDKGAISRITHCDMHELVERLFLSHLG